MTTWITDNNGNRASVEYFGTDEAARKALDSLEDCRNCTNCSYCSYCSRCSYCSYCSDCSYCSRCSDCSYCSRCSDCSYCSGLKNENGDFTPPAVPMIDNIHAKVLEAASAPRALRMDNWHTCGTTHCRAGWVVHLAGEAGYALERFHGTALAAQIIYRESNPSLPVSPTRFYETNEEALADMRRMAEREAEIAAEGRS